MLGDQGGQILVSITRTETVYERVDLGPVSFVPLLGGAD